MSVTRHITFGLLAATLWGGALQPASARKRGAEQLPVDSSAIAQQRRDLEIGQSMETFFNIFREVNLNYVDTTSPARLMRDASDAMLEGLDPYTEYLPAEEMADFETMTTGKYAGLGALIRKSTDGRWIEVAEPYRGAPSAGPAAKKESSLPWPLSLFL